MSELASNGADLGGGAIAVSGLVIALSLIFVGLRFYTRIWTRLGLWWDDWLILVAVITMLATAGLVLAGNHVDPNGDTASFSNDPKYRLSEANQIYLKLGFAASVLYFTIAGASKLGILLMYSRLFFISDGFRIQVAIASALVIAYWVVCTVATLLTCRPLSYIWLSGASGFPTYCFNFNVFWMAVGCVELILDAIILSLPLRAVMNMNLSSRRKLSVMGIFLLGGIVIITGIVKVILAYNPGGHTPLSGPAEVCATLHAGLGIVCACLPILKPLLTRVTGGSAPSSVAGYGYSASRYGGRRGTAEPDDWNVIHLNVGRSESDYDSLHSYSPSLKSPGDAHFRDAHFRV